MKKQLLLLLLLLGATMAWAQKSMYLPREWRNRTDTLIWAESDPDNRYTWSKSRSRESDNVIVLWDKGYGSVIPTNAPQAYRVDIGDLLNKAEQFFDLEINQLGFVDAEKSNLSKYKVMILLNHSTEWICYGGGYDFMVPALWLSPSTCKPVGHSVAHEIGHSFHYMCYAEASAYGTKGGVETGFHSAVGNGSVTWEQTAQWQANQSFPQLMFEQSIGVFKNSHNYAFTHEWHRYQSYWFFYYLCQHYNDIKTLANVWNTPETTVKDFNQVLMDSKSLSAPELFALYYDYAARLATWDLEACQLYCAPYIGAFNYRCVMTGDRQYQVALSSCPQATGFNILPLSVPMPGSRVVTHFTALSNGAPLANGDPAQILNGETQLAGVSQKTYNRVSTTVPRGFRLGYVALLADGTRVYLHEDSVYCRGTGEVTADITATVPEGTERLWLIVSPAPLKYLAHKWDERIAGDDMWPYRITLEGTDLAASATVYASPAIDGRAICDTTLTYNVCFPPSASAYAAIDITVNSRAAQMLGTAFQMVPTDIADKMQAYKASGPDEGKVMFYPAKADGTLVKRGSTANGYGHWFAANGTPTEYVNGRLYSEFNPATLTFTLGQFPGRLKAGDTFTIAQALRYKKSATEEATAVFVFNVRIADGLAQAEFQQPGSTETAVGNIGYGWPSGGQWRFDLQGRRTEPSLPGLYIRNGHKYINSCK